MCTEIGDFIFVILKEMKTISLLFINGFDISLWLRDDLIFIRRFIVCNDWILAITSFNTKILCSLLVGHNTNVQIFTKFIWEKYILE